MDTDEIGSNVDTDIPGISVPAWILNPKNKKSAPTWMLIFQEIGSNVDADISGILVPVYFSVELKSQCQNITA
ncbi:hypothetical protein RhiirC2_801210 [Rhizophagus irregularis]|uniref:Uncharacterized protein n=1 Tax=Rhizophagus irregularis TaxID=588596 RepID=A0A2N1M2L4_9GLOM|nr:hypothetical protein RhiirC2_801210 [Rhizophagus irregularis]